MNIFSVPVKSALVAPILLYCLFDTIMVGVKAPVTFSPDGIKVNTATSAKAETERSSMLETPKLINNGKGRSLNE